MTIRQCQITGMQLSPDSIGVITMNGTEVFNGEFLAEIGVTNSTLATCSVDVDNALSVSDYVSVPTVITVTSGSMNFGLSTWNYGVRLNPIYSQEQRATLEDLNTTNSQRLQIYNAVVTTPLSAADQAILASADPADLPAIQALKVTNNLTIYLQNETQFDIAIGDIINRANVLLDGVEPSVANTNVGVAVNEGQVLTYDSLVFVSNWWMKT